MCWVWVPPPRPKHTPAVRFRNGAQANGGTPAGVTTGTGAIATTGMADQVTGTAGPVGMTMTMAVGLAALETGTTGPVGQAGHMAVDLTRPE